MLVVAVVNRCYFDTGKVEYHKTASKILCRYNTLTFVKEVEEIANQIDYTLEEDAFCRQLENAIRSKLGIEFNHQPVEHIFRVRKK